MSSRTRCSTILCSLCARSRAMRTNCDARSSLRALLSARFCACVDLAAQFPVRSWSKTPACSTAAAGLALLVPKDGGERFGILHGENALLLAQLSEFRELAHRRRDSDCVDAILASSERIFDRSDKHLLRPTAASALQGAQRTRFFAKTSLWRARTVANAARTPLHRARRVVTAVSNLACSLTWCVNTLS